MISEICKGLGAPSLLFAFAVGALSASFTDVVRAEQAQSKKILPDAAISAAVESELFADYSVPHDDIDVGTNAGVVTLTGTVNNLMARDHAQRLAQTVRGVRSVVNRIAVEPRGKRSDQQLRDDVIAAMAYDAATDSYELRVSVSDRVATLSGKVDSYAERDLAEKVARGVHGLRDVRNQISVQYKSSRPDPEIRADVLARLRWDAYVEHELISAKVAAGNVELSGKIGSEAERGRAYADAWVAGVRSVNADKLEVEPWLKSQRARKPSPKVGDREIERAVSAALLYDPRVSSFNVAPSATGGVVTLRGNVDNLKAKRAALGDARATTGVSRVIDRIHVRLTPKDDKTIAKNIRSAFERDPYVERFEVSVNVVDGTAYLNGTVDSSWEKMRADQLASVAAGVKSVRNNLTVYDDRSPLVYEPRVYDHYPYDYSWYSYTPGSWREDAEIQDEIKDELFWSPFVDADQVKVHVSDGVATLEGTVDSYSEMHSALSNAYEGGAKSVQNELKVN